MNILQKDFLIESKYFLIMIAIIAVISGFSRDVHAGGFVGGLVVGHVVGNVVRSNQQKNQAIEYAAYHQPATQQSSTKTTEQKLGELDTLAAKGYITKSEYQSRKKAILDQM